MRKDGTKMGLMQRLAACYEILTGSEETNAPLPIVVSKLTLAYYATVSRECFKQLMHDETKFSLMPIIRDLCILTERISTMEQYPTLQDKVDRLIPLTDAIVTLKALGRDQKESNRDQIRLELESLAFHCAERIVESAPQ